MSFSLPKNVPSFESSQRRYENAYWGSSGITHQNGHAGIGDKLGGFFDNQALPMYKDKPYAHGASKRQKPLLRRRRVWFGLILILCGLLSYSWMHSSVTEEDEGVKSRENAVWKWFRRPAKSIVSVDWNDRREKVKDVFILSWDGYERYAWGMFNLLPQEASIAFWRASLLKEIQLTSLGYDEYHPVSKQGTQIAPSGLGWIIVDALDTLMIMNLTSRLSHAREWISTSLNYDQDLEVNTFETTIRMLGGLLSAHYLSTTFQEMAPLPEDDHGKPGEDLYLEKAADLADRLLGAFDTESGVPYTSVNLKTLKGKAPDFEGGAASTAEAASLQLEFKYLALLMGEKTYWEKSEKVIQVIDDNGMEDGLLPIYIYADKGTFRGENIRLGSRGDSYYGLFVDLIMISITNTVLEYLIKQYFQTSQEEPVYLELWNQALAGVRKHLITYTKHSHFTVLGERPDGLDKNISPKMDHLVCFMPGTIALGATGGLPLAEAKKSKEWEKRQEQDMELARELTKTCWGMYKVSATGLAPEIAHFNIEDPPHMELDGKISSEIVDFDTANASWKADYVIKQPDSHNLQRPETVESLFYMWRITGDVVYREWGWEMFKSFVQYTTVEDGAGFTSLSRANEIPPIVKDNMESFWLVSLLSQPLRR